MKKILGMGNSLVDILIKLDKDDYLSELELEKGSMTLVDKERMNRILALTQSLGIKRSSGGSAANTINGLAILGCDTGFIGKVGDDEYGIFFKSDMKSNRIETNLFKGDEETGKCVVLVSPDSERTMSTYLGAAIELCEQDLSAELFKGYDFFHVEGYFVQDKNLLNKALQYAKAAGLTISMDLSSFNIVTENKRYFHDIIQNYIDILFANEDETLAFTGLEDYDAALKYMGRLCKMAILKKGADGSTVVSDGTYIQIDAEPAKAVDTTGAGDLFASGFFYGLLQDYPIEICGKIGAKLGKNAVEIMGARMGAPRWNKIKTEIAQIEADLP